MCSRVWIADPYPVQSRGVVEMHTYVLVNGHWVDVTSQSITVNKATFIPIDADGYELAWLDDGADLSQSTCRVNGPSGRIACGAPNTGRVAFYSRGFNGIAQKFQNCIYRVSRWRAPSSTARPATATAVAWSTVGRWVDRQVHRAKAQPRDGEHAPSLAVRTVESIGEGVMAPSMVVRAAARQQPAWAGSASGDRDISRCPP